jgi:hypothetical protein
LGNASIDKEIPRHLWIAVRSEKEPLNYQMQPLFQRNSRWEVHVCGNDMKDEFMNKTFANTSLLWAYHMIHPVAGAAKADLWRYAVLWTYGGVYIDDDSDMMQPLDKVIEPEDTLVVAYEKNGFNGNRCYIPRFHLSDFSSFRNESRSKEVFYGRVLLNWAIMAAPRHPVLAAVMKNAVEIIKHEFFQDSLIRSLYTMHRWEAIMCATGPSLLTGTARELVLDKKETFTYKLANLDFRDFGGKFKAFHMPVKNDPNHYMRTMQRKGAPGLLSYYLPEQPISPEKLKSWQGEAVQGQNGKEIFVVDDGKRRGIPNYDTFLALNFTMADVHVVSDAKLSSIPLGSSMPNLST